MCVIICGNPNNIKTEYLKNAYEKNPHGFGLMYLKNKKIVAVKYLPKNFKQVLKTFDKHKNKTNQIAIHFRLATVGYKNNFNSHPFFITNEKLFGDTFDCALMHNSPLIPAPLLSEKYSDSYYFSRYILRPILKNKPELILNQSFLNALDKIINAECDTRVLLLNNKNNSFIFLGEWHDYKNLKVSNTYSLENYFGNSTTSEDYFNTPYKSGHKYFSDDDSNYKFKSYSKKDLSELKENDEKILDQVNEDQIKDEENSIQINDINNNVNNEHELESKNITCDEEIDHYKNIFEKSSLEEIHKEIEHLTPAEIAILISEIQVKKEVA